MASFVDRNDNGLDYITVGGTLGNGVAYPDKPLDAHSQGLGAGALADGLGQWQTPHPPQARHPIPYGCASPYYVSGTLGRIHVCIGACADMCNLVGLSLVHLTKSKE